MLVTSESGAHHLVLSRSSLGDTWASSPHRTAPHTYDYHTISVIEIFSFSRCIAILWPLKQSLWFAQPVVANCLLYTAPDGVKLFVQQGEAMVGVVLVIDDVVTLSSNAPNHCFRNPFCSSTTMRLGMTLSRGSACRWVYDLVIVLDTLNRSFHRHQKRLFECGLKPRLRILSRTFNEMAIDSTSDG